MKKDLDELISKCEETSQTLKKQTENMKKDLDELMSKKAALTKEVEQCRLNQKESAKKAAELEATIKAKQKEVDDLTKHVTDLQAENAKKSDENKKLKKDLEEALKNGSSGEESKKLKEEIEKLKEENDKLEKEIAKVKETKPVDLSGASYDATSAALFCEAEKAFTDDDTLSWTSDGDAPQTIWVQFKEAKRVTQFSFRCSDVPANGASKFELVATNDATCNDNSNWDILYQDLSGKGFAKEQEEIKARVGACKLYSCYTVCT